MQAQHKKNWMRSEQQRQPLVVIQIMEQEVLLRVLGHPTTQGMQQQPMVIQMVALVVPLKVRDKGKAMLVMPKEKAVIPLGHKKLMNLPGGK